MSVGEYASRALRFQRNGRPPYQPKLSDLCDSDAENSFPTLQGSFWLDVSVWNAFAKNKSQDVAVSGNNIKALIHFYLGDSS